MTYVTAREKNNPQGNADQIGEPTALPQRGMRPLDKLRRLPRKPTVIVGGNLSSPPSGGVVPRPRVYERLRLRRVFLARNYWRFGCNFVWN